MRSTPHRTLGAGVLTAAALVALSLPAIPAAAQPARGTAAADCTPAQSVSNGGFESGTSPWTQSSSGVITSRTGQSAHGGSSFAWLDGVGSTHTDTLTQSVTIPSGCSSATLTFWLHIDTDETTSSIAYDKLTAKIGSTTLATYSNLDDNTGYVQKSFDVSSFAGQTVNLSFTGTEDSSLKTSFVLDDVALDTSGGTTPPPSDSTRTPAAPSYTVSLSSDTSARTAIPHYTFERTTHCVGSFSCVFANEESTSKDTAKDVAAD